MIINRIYETQNLLLLYLVSFLVGLRTYQHLCKFFMLTAYLTLFPIFTFLTLLCCRYNNRCFLIQELS